MLLQIRGKFMISVSTNNNKKIYFIIITLVETEIMNLPLIWSNKTKFFFFLLVETKTMGVVGKSMGLTNM